MSSTRGPGRSRSTLPPSASRTRRSPRARARPRTLRRTLRAWLSRSVTMRRTMRAQHSPSRISLLSLIGSLKRLASGQTPQTICIAARWPPGNSPSSSRRLARPSKSTKKPSASAPRVRPRPSRRRSTTRSRPTRSAWTTRSATTPKLRSSARRQNRSVFEQRPRSPSSAPGSRTSVRRRRLLEPRLLPTPRKGS